MKEWAPITVVLLATVGLLIHLGYESSLPVRYKYLDTVPDGTYEVTFDTSPVTKGDLVVTDGLCDLHYPHQAVTTYPKGEHAIIRIKNAIAYKTWIGDRYNGITIRIFENNVYGYHNREKKRLWK